jgi:hypothetical protein
MSDMNTYRVPPCVAWLANIQDGGVPGFRIVREGKGYPMRAVWIEGDDIARVVRAVLDLGEASYGYDPDLRGHVGRAVRWAERTLSDLTT